MPNTLVHFGRLEGDGKVIYVSGCFYLYEVRYLYFLI